MGRTAVQTAGRVGGAVLALALATAAMASPAIAAPAMATPASASPSYTATSMTASPPAAGSSDTGNHCDDCATTISPGFAVRLYGLGVSSLQVSANGNLQVVSTATDWGSTNLPNSDFGLTVFPFWDDLRTDGPNVGVFSTVLGSAGSRALVLEWRATMFTTGAPVDVTLVLHEDTSNFETYYTKLPPNDGATATEGVQRNGLGPSTQWASHSSVLAAGEEVAYTLPATPPSVTSRPSVAITVGGQAGAMPQGVALGVTVSWAVSPGAAPICSTRLARAMNGGSWTSVPVPSATATSAADVLMDGNTHYQYEVDVTDCDGGTSGWVTAPSFTYNLVQETNSQWSFLPSASWTAATCASCSAGHARVTRAAGAVATFAAHAAIAVGLVGETGPQFGRASVTVDKTAYHVTTTAGAAGYRIVVLSHAWAAPGPHTIRVQNLATAADPAFEVDAMAVLTSP